MACVACGGQAEEIGDVPYAFHFLAQRLSTPLDTGDLYACRDCGLWFKHPYLSESFLKDGYSSAPENLAWSNNELRQDFVLARQALEAAFPTGGDVLDLGCYVGEFLRSLPDSFRKFGIEPCAQAASAAEAEGIQIFNASPEDLGTAQFQAITLFDVFEHLSNPLKTVDALFGRLRAGGLLVIGTGLADYPVFHAVGAKYHYVCMPEHVCFLTRKFAAFLGRRYGASYRLMTLSRNRSPLRTHLRVLARDAVNLPSLLVREKQNVAKLYPSPRLQQIAAEGIAPFWPAADHALLLISKTAAPSSTAGTAA